MWRFDVSPAPSAEPGPVFSIDVECSSGTYVRSLAADLGALLGGGAHLRKLRREATGEFTVDEALTLEELEASPSKPDAVMSSAEALRDLPRAVAGQALRTAVGYGQVVELEVLRQAGASGPGPWAVVDEDGKLLAVYEGRGPRHAKPAVVLSLSS